MLVSCSVCLPAGFHANVNNLLALIPLVAHLHNDTVHYRMEYFHYKARLEPRSPSLSGTLQDKQ